MRFKKIQALVLSFFLWVITSLPFGEGWGGAFAQQNYPIQLNVQLIPPYSGYLPDYATAGNEKLKVILLQKDLTQPMYNVRLAMKLEGNGYTISTKPFFKGQPISLQAGVPLEISGSDIYDFLNSVNLDFSGLNKNTYEQGQALPEGYYSICFTAYDYNSPTPTQVSNQSCAQAWMTLSDPPFLYMPICGSTVQTNTPQNVVFGWSPMNTGSPNSANQTEYIFELWETRPNNNANPNNIVLSAPPVQTYTTDFTTYNYGMTETQLIAGMQYIWRVRAHDKSNRDLFKNQGYSQICTFVYGSIYDGLNLNLTANSKGTSYRQGKVWWNGLSVFTQYTIQYRKVNGATSTWFTAYSTTPELKINDLEENTAYEAKVQGMANDGYIGPWSNTTTFTTPKKPVIACGDQIVPEPGQAIVPLAFATQGMRFKAGLFEVLVTSVQGGAGYFSGTGKVFVPMFGSLLNVTFDNVFVDDNQTVLSGNFYAVTKGVTNWMHDYDVTTAEDNAVTVPGSISGVSVNDSQYCYTTTVNGTSTQSCAPIPPNTNVVVIRDDNGNQYTIQVIPAPPTVTGPTNYLNNTTDDLQICDSLTVTFEASTNQAFGFDKKEYTAYIPNYEVYTTPSNKKYFIPYKSIGEGQTDEVFANIQINNFNASKLSFKTQNGTVLNATNQGTNQYVVSNIPAAANCVYAYYNNKKVGKLNIVSLKPITKKVVIVPVNGASNTITASLLNGVFKQANVAWTLTTASSFTFDLGADGLQEADATLLAKYSAEMRALRDAYKQANSNYDKDAYYIFVVPNFSIAQLKGYMVRGRALGFVTANATIKEIAHELAHGAFGLEHTFPKLEQSSSNNLLDYGAGTQLTKLQWDEMQNPSATTNWNDSEEDGAALNPSCFFDVSDKYLYAPNGHLFKAPALSKLNYILSSYMVEGFVYGLNVGAKNYFADIPILNGVQNANDFYGFKTEDGELLPLTYVSSATSAYFPYKSGNIIKLYQVANAQIPIGSNVNVQDLNAGTFFNQLLSSNSANVSISCNCNAQLSVDQIQLLNKYKNFNVTIETYVYDQGNLITLLPDGKKYIRKYAQTQFDNLKNLLKQGKLDDKEALIFEKTASGYSLSVNYGNNVNAKYGGITAKDNSELALEKVLNRYLKDKQNLGLQHSEQESQVFEDGKKISIKQSNIWDLVCNSIKAGKELIEQAEIKPHYWNSTDAGYANNWVNTPPLLSGVGNGVIEEIKEIPQLVFLTADIATNKQTRDKIWEGFKGLTLDKVKTAASSTLNNWTDTYAQGGDPAWHQGGKDGVMVFSMLTPMGFIKNADDALSKNTDDVVGSVRKKSDNLLWKTFLEDPIVISKKNEVVNSNLPTQFPNLSIDELTAIKVYTSDQMKNGAKIYKTLNDELRAGNLNEFNKGLNDLMNNGLNKLPEHNGNVFRGVYGQEATTAKTWIVDQEIQFKDFKSSSTNKQLAAFEFSQKYNGDVIYEIIGAKGCNICSIACIPNEMEVLLKSNLKFKIKNITPNHMIYDLSMDNPTPFTKIVLELTP